MDIDSIITTLQAFKKKYGGDKKVFISSDEEGNKITEVFEITLWDDNETKEIVMWPNE